VNSMTNLRIHESFGVSGPPDCHRLFRRFRYMELDAGSPCLTWGDVAENDKVERNNVEWRIHHQHHPNKNELKYSSVCLLSVKTRLTDV